jgi:Domain of unknown function (DUF4386)
LSNRKGKKPRQRFSKDFPNWLKEIKMNTTKESPHGTNRTTAIIVGVLFIIGTVAGVLSVFVMGGFSMDAPAYLNMAASNPSQVALGGLLVLVMGLALAMVPAMMFPILKRWNEALAIGYVIFRGAMETFTYIAVAICWLLLVVVARQYADSGAAVPSQFGSLGILLVKAQDPIIAVQDIVFGLGALLFYYLLYQARLIRPLAKVLKQGDARARHNASEG